jgi:hypothetical protein
MMRDEMANLAWAIERSSEYCVVFMPAAARCKSYRRDTVRVNLRRAKHVQPIEAVEESGIVTRRSGE